jgi:hypothetical protein
MNYFYDNQFERYLLQFMRIFSDISVRYGPDENGAYELKRIPIVNGAMSRHVANILKNGSENTLISTPMFSAYIKEIELDPARRSDTTFTHAISRAHREFVNGQYTSKSGNRITIERFMPVPYKLTFMLDILTSNIQSKMQILEQILTIFNPMLQLQQNSNFADWSRLFEVELSNVNWSGNSLPIGADDSKEIATLTFTVPIWMNPPSLVTQTRRIEQIVTNINSVSDIPTEESLKDDYDPFSTYNPLTQVIVTPENYCVSIGIDSNNNELLLLNQYGSKNTALGWEKLLDLYGGIKTGTQIILKTNSNIENFENEIIGTIALSNDKDIITFNIDADSLPTANFIFNAIIDPKEDIPGINLPLPTAGTKYLLTSDHNNGEEPLITTGTYWNIFANTNDIIEYDGTSWNVIFNSQQNTDIKYAINTNNNNHYTFSNNEWTYTYLGKYFPGYWRIEQPWSKKQQ